MGWTVAHVARLFPHLRCFSCELSKANFGVAVSRTREMANALIENMPSPDFLYHRLAQQPELAKAKAMFWLDAHGKDVPCPLADEVRFITSTFSDAVIFIDDFQVPGRPEFGFDTYSDGIALTWDYIRPALDPRRTYTIMRPCYRTKTSLQDPMRGWIMLAVGEWDMPKNAPELYEVTYYNVGGASENADSRQAVGAQTLSPG
jgi:hypothetical protein